MIETKRAADLVSSDVVVERDGATLTVMSVGRQKGYVYVLCERDAVGPRNVIATLRPNTQVRVLTVE